MRKTLSPKEAKLHRNLGCNFFNETWKYLKKKRRTPAENDRMIHLAHASRLHWEFVGTPENLAIGEWQVSRVYSVLKMSSPALYHARRCLEISKRNRLSDFMLGCSHEAMARALSVSRDKAAAKHLRAAKHVLSKLTDPDEKSILDGNLKTIKI